MDMHVDAHIHTVAFSVTVLLLGTRRAWFCTFFTEVKAQEATQPKPKPLQEVTGMSGGGALRCGAPV